MDGKKHHLPFAGLKPYTWYAVSVEAATIAGFGPNIQRNHRTGESGKEVKFLYGKNLIDKNFQLWKYELSS